MHSPEAIRFGPYEIRLRTQELFKHGLRLRLAPQAFQVLRILLEQPGQLVTREDLHQALWPADTFVDFDHGVNNAIKRIRDVLSDSVDAPVYIETLPRLGYRFIGPIDRNGSESTPASVAEPPAASTLEVRESQPAAKTRRWPQAAIVVGTAALVGLAAAWWFLLRSPQASTQRDSIVLADFLNTTGDPVFDDTLRQQLSVQLEQSPSVSIVSDQQAQQALQLMGEKTNAKLTPEIAREVCQRTAGTAVLNGSIAQVGTRYLLLLKTVNCSSGQSMTSAEAQASDKNHVLDALGKAASETRKKLGESLASIHKFDAPLEPVTTSSLEALKTFSVYARGGGLVPAFPMLQHVIALDPNFADAYAQLSDAYDDAREPELASEYAQKAFDLRGRVTERERLSITGKYDYYVLGNLDQELSTHRVFEQMYPRAWGPWNDASCSWRLLADHERALEEAREALRLGPDAVNPHLSLGSALLCLERKKDARQIAEQALAHGLDVPGTHLLIYQVAFLEDNTKEMEAQLGPLLGGAGREASIDALLTQSNTEAYFGRLRNSLAFSERALEMARRNNFHEAAAQILASAAVREAEFGNLGRAGQAANMALSLSSGRSAKLFASLALARAGQVGRAQALADELDKKFPSNTMMQSYWLPMIRGSIELSRKNPLKALGALQGASLDLSDTGALVGNLYPAFVRGQAYLGMHRGKEAAVEFQKLLDHRSIVLNSPLGALAHLGLARAYLLQGNATNSRAAYEDFLTRWKDADQDIPILKQAKAEYARLP